MVQEELNRFNVLNELSIGKFEAFLYDCDGTLVNNMPAHQMTYVEVALRYGVRIDPIIITELAGWPVVDVVREINRRYGACMDPQDFARSRQELFMNKYIDQVEPIAFVVRHLIDNAGRVKIGVVSGGEREAVDRSLRLLGVDHLVQVSICAGETKRGKPYPDPFLAAAQVLNVAPEKCLVFEDGQAGVDAAHSAGMWAIRIDKL